MMDQDCLDLIIKLRSSVGCLGEQGENKWWKGNFFSPSSAAFLKPIFHTTSHVAIYQGVKSEASIVHDEYIGNGAGVYHLFRLPETLEIDLLDIVKKHPEMFLINTQDSRSFLESYIVKHDSKKVGPVFIDKIEGIANIENWKQIASFYNKAFKDNNFVYPFFARGDR